LHRATSSDFWRHNYAVDPDSGMANSGMGDAMLKADRIEEASAYYQGARELQPEYQPTLLGLAFIDLRRDRFADAIPKLETYLASHYENRNANPGDPASIPGDPVGDRRARQGCRQNPCGHQRPRGTNHVDRRCGRCATR
jgi:hypothetical protein